VTGVRIYATYNIKGGVGKTTTAVNLAYLAAAESGLRTVLWDLDPQGAASFMFRVKPRVKGGGKALIHGKRPLDDAIKGTDFDNLDLDCPPSISLVSENVLHAADVIVVPLIPTTLSVRTLDQLTEFVAGFNGRRPDVLAFFSMVDRRKKLHKEITQNLSSQRSDVAATAVPYLSLVENMSVERAPVTVFAPRSAAARAFRELWAEIRSRDTTGGG
jgi:chromosome partitioning protein